MHDNIPFSRRVNSSWSISPLNQGIHWIQNVLKRPNNQSVLQKNIWSNLKWQSQTIF